MTASAGPLAGLRIVDLSRILAAPTCSQLLGDLGADVVKVERPGAGDDTRKWGPPYVVDADGNETSESAYYLSSNRNKRSVAIDFSKPEGAALVKRLLGSADVLLENFKVGSLARYGLGYDELKEEFPDLVYCSVTGFGQGGPYAGRAGYDFLAQGMGGIMSLTGAIDGEPMKVGVGISDVVCGLYAATAILAALRHRDAGGGGQHIDMSLLDSQVAWLVNAGTYYLLSGQVPPRLGNGHPNIVPYQVFPSSDGHFILAVGNDAQFRRFCEFAGIPELADDPAFAKNADRVRNRERLIPRLEAVTATRSRADWLEGMERLGVPAGPVNDIAQVFDDPQVRHREMRITMPHPLAGSGSVDLIGSPVRLSKTDVSYRLPPPTLGQHTGEILDELGVDGAERARLAEAGIL
jgi:crotonobetainyl-CoA:carnitine CoA-transferase CaiB-like acyl-CoA transferase